MPVRQLAQRVVPAVFAAAALLTGVPSAATATAPAPPDIPVSAVQGHLATLQKIADDNGGNRAHGEPGNKATVDFLTSTLKKAGFEVRAQEFTAEGRTGWNVIADWPGGNAGDVLMLGGHLDSVHGGPGINDNGSGTAGLLEVALTVAEQNFQPGKHLRFAWWGAEELGLLGSTHYVQDLPAAERDKIGGYLNFDMTGSPNPGYFVYTSDGQPEGSAGLEENLRGYFESAGVAPEPVDVGGRSDHAAFADAGVPTGGTFSGAEETKTAEQAEKWGGQAGEAFDPCYHADCDTAKNIDEKALDRHTDAIANAVWTLATR